MQTIQTTFRQEYLTKPVKTSLAARFLTWTNSQETRRFGWLAAMLFIHGCVLTPVTIGTVFLGGNHFIFWGFVIAAMTMTLVSNLAAMPTRFTIPIFFFSVLVDFAIIIINLVIFFQA